MIKNLELCFCSPIVAMTDISLFFGLDDEESRSLRQRPRRSKYSCTGFEPLFGDMNEASEVLWRLELYGSC